MSIAAEGLRFLGAEVAFLPAPNDAKLPDLLANFGNCRVLVEEKDKYDSPEEARRRKDAFDRGEVFSSALPIVPNNRISGIKKRCWTIGFARYTSP